MYTYGLDEQSIIKTIKWTLRIGLTASVLLVVFGAFIFFKATWLIMFPDTTLWSDARVQNLLIASGLHFSSGLFLYKNMLQLIEAKHTPKNQVVLKLFSDK